MIPVGGGSREKSSKRTGVEEILEEKGGEMEKGKREGVCERGS